MAVMFGQNATYATIESRLRRYRKMAEELRKEARARGVTDIPPRGGGGGRVGRDAAGGVSTPRTPRGPPRSKCTPSMTGSGRGSTAKKDKQWKLLSVVDTPSKKGKSSTDVISLLDDSDDDMIKPDEKEEADVKTEAENGTPVKMEGIDGQSVNATPTERGRVKRSRDLSPRTFARKHNRRVDSRTNGYAEANLVSPVSSPARGHGNSARDTEAPAEGSAVSSKSIEITVAASPPASQNQAAEYLNDDDMSDTA